MKSLLTGPAIFFFAGIIVTALIFGAVDFQYGTTNFWENHGVFFLVFISFFPRLTLLFSSVATGGILWWLGFIFYPRLLVAVLATMAYLQTNPLLVGIAWFVAISGEFAEKKGIVANKRFIVRHYGSTPHEQGPREFYGEKKNLGGDYIEAEFEKKDS